jgi:hypothetical protein
MSDNVQAQTKNKKDAAGDGSAKVKVEKEPRQLQTFATLGVDFTGPAPDESLTDGSADGWNSDTSSILSHELSTLLLRRSRVENTKVAGPSVVVPTFGGRNFCNIPTHASARPAIQPKLTVGAAHDPYEQEADQVAEQVMRMPAIVAAPPGGADAPEPGGNSIQRAPEEEEEIQTKPLAATIRPFVQRTTPKSENEAVQRAAEDEDELQTKRVSAADSFEVGGDFENRVAGSGGGSPLPDETRAFMEPRFGMDFSGVRVHSGGEAAELNRSVSAQAFTLGRDIYLGEGQTDVASDGGKRLLAHELTHVVQQGGAVRRKPKGKVTIPEKAIRSSRLMPGNKSDKANFMREVYEAQLQDSANDKNKEFFTGQGLKLGHVEGKQEMREDAAKKCKELLVQARTDLKQEQDSIQPPKPRKGRVTEARKVRAIGIGSGYRSMETELGNWQTAFNTAYSKTRKERSDRDGGEHGKEAKELMVGRLYEAKAIPGYSQHTKGLGADFTTTEAGYNTKKKKHEEYHFTSSGEQASSWPHTWLYNWLLVHAKTYGFQPYSKEPWHWNYKNTKKPTPARSSDATGQDQTGEEGGNAEPEAGEILQEKPLTTCDPAPQRVPEEEEEIQTKPLAATIRPFVQRTTPKSENEAVQRAVKDEDELQTKRVSAADSFEVGGDFENRVAGSGGGSPLPDETRAFMEPRFNMDFSGVRVHSGGEAADLNRSVSAWAFTLGRDIYLGAGQTEVASDGGKRARDHGRNVGSSPLTIQRKPNSLQKRATKLAQELQTLIGDATWKEIRKRVYPKESAAGIKRAKKRHAGTLPDLTGLGQLKRLDHFAKQVRDIQTKWTTLSPDERAEKLGKAASVELTAVGVPGFLVVDKMPLTAKGFFSPSEWKFVINEALVSGGSLSDDAAAQVVNIALHESRHAEQSFLAARFSAGVNKKRSSAIVAEQGIPKIIADQAVAKKFDAKTDPSVAALGKQMYQATVTEGAKNQATSNDVDKALADLAKKCSEAQIALTSLKAAAIAQTIAAATAARNNLRAQITVVEKKYTLYRNIPYEANAHEVGDAAEQAFRGWP